MSRWRLRLLGLAIGTASALVVAELGLRVFHRLRPPQSEPLNWQESGDDLYLTGPPLAFELRPGARRHVRCPEYEVDVEVGAHGLREPTRAVEKAPGKKRVLVIGDSFAFGQGVAEPATFSRRLEALLGRTDVEVLNGGVGGYSTGQEYVWLRERGLRFAPDVVVVAVAMNDTCEWAHALGADGLPELYAGGDRAALDRAASEGRPIFMPRSLALLPEESTDRRGIERVSYLAWRVRLAASELREKYFPPLARRGERFWVPGTQPFVAGDAETDAFAVLRGEPWSLPLEEAWSRLERFLGGIVGLARRHGARVVVAPVPLGPQVSADEWVLGRRAHGFGAERLGREPQRRLEAFAAREGVAFLDLIGPLETAGDAGGLRFFSYDGHLSERGHEIVAKALTPVVAAEVR